MNETPFHLAIIPDGNRRWAKREGLKSYKSLYDRGIDGLVAITDAAFDAGVTHLTLWGSSHANLTARSSEFFLGIDRAFRDNIHRFADSPVITKHDIRIRIIGEWRESLSKDTIVAFDDVMARTADHSSRELTLLIDYSGTRERTEAVRALLESPPPAFDVTDDLLTSLAWTGHLPPVDLIIRTGAWLDPHNSAGFMSLLTDEAQFSFPELLWPDFTPEHLERILDDFRTRERRHGK